MRGGVPPYDRVVSLVAAAAILDDLTTPVRLLAARRSAPPSLARLWEFPGGKVEPGEDPVAALHRELREELGIAVALGAEILPPDGAAWPAMNGHTMRVWTAVITDGDPRPLADHDELRWLTRDTWLKVPWLPADLPVLEAIEPALTHP